MRAQDKEANLRLVMGISRWVIERIDALPALAKAAHRLDPLTLLQGANGVVTSRLREYRGASVEEFRRILDEALAEHFRHVFGHGP
jgi:hypothetical protein